MKRWIATILLLGLWLLPAIALAQSQNDTRLIPAGEHISGDVATVSALGRTIFARHQSQCSVLSR